MKISPVASANATGQPGANIGSIELGKSASSDRLAAAKAVAAGQPKPEAVLADPQAQRAAESIRKIKMRTNVSPDRNYEPTATEPVAAAPAQSATPDGSVKTTEAAEDTKPISPQFAALARQKRSLQLKEKELADREAKIAQAPTNGNQNVMADLKANPLRVLQEAGVTYEQLTEAIVNNQNGVNPEIQALRAEIAALKEGVDKSLTDRDTQAEQQVYAEMLREANGLIAQGDTYEMIRETKSQPDVMELIRRTWKETGEVLDVSEACNLVEEELLNETLKYAKLKKVQSKVAPAPVQQQSQAPQRTMKTLTNRDNATPQMSRRDRMMAAFNGTLKKG